MTRARLLQLGFWGVLPLMLASCEVAPASKSSVVTAEGETKQPMAARLSREALAAVGMEERWYLPPADRSALDVGIQSAFLLEEGLFVVSMPRRGGQDRYLKRIDREKGEAAWYEKINGRIENQPTTYTYPPAGDGTQRPPELFFNLLDTVYCLDLRYGHLLWETQMKFPISSSVVADETHLFIGSDNHRVYGVRKGASQDDWTHLTGKRVSAAPVLSGSKVIFASNDGAVYGLDAAQGWVNLDSWTLDTGAPILANMTPVGRWVFVGSADYKLYCIEAADGSVYWSFVAEAPIKDQPVAYSHRANQDYVYCISTKGSGRRVSRTLFAMSIPKGEFVARGQSIWQVDGVSQVVSMGRDTLYVLDEGSPRSLLGLDVASGKEKFRLSLEGFHLVPTNHADVGRNLAERGKVFLVSRSGAIQCIGEKL